MRHKVRAWVLVCAVVLFCAAALWTAAYYRSSASASLPRLLARLPANDSAVFLYLDFGTIRRADAVSALAASGVAEDSGYRKFVEQTGFDYRQDLDSALVSFAPRATYMLVRGRFDWKALTAFAIAAGGACRNTLCWMPGSLPERKISFYPVRKDLMALAVSPDELAATAMMDVKRQPPLAAPTAPLWVYVPHAALARYKSPPDGTKLLIQALGEAQSVLLTLAPANGGMEAHLEAECRSDGDAEKLEGHLTALTTFVKSTIAKEKQVPNPRDLSGVLTAGVFTRAGTLVSGRWPIAREFLQSITGAP